MTSKQPSVHDLDAALRRFDPADETVTDALTDAQQERSAATLARILATDPADVSEAPSAPAPKPTRRGLRRALVAVPIGAAAVAALVVLPGLGGDRPAYAGWTATPVVLTGSELRDAVDDCLAHQRQDLDAPSLDGAVPLLAERRGGWTYVLARVDTTEASCLMPADRDRDDAWMGSLNPDADLVEAAPRQALETTVMTSSTDEGLFNSVEGLVGDRVASITITSATGQVIEASIAHGHYAAWWPAGANRPDNPELTEAHTTRVEYRDGSSTDLR